MRSGGDSCSSKYFCVAVFPWCLLSVVKDPSVEKDALAGDRDWNAKPQDVFGIPHFSGGLADRKHDASIHGIHRGGHGCRRNGNAQVDIGKRAVSAGVFAVAAIIKAAIVAVGHAAVCLLRANENYRMCPADVGSVPAVPGVHFIAHFADAEFLHLFRQLFLLVSGQDERVHRVLPMRLRGSPRGRAHLSRRVQSSLFQDNHFRTA